MSGESQQAPTGVLSATGQANKEASMGSAMSLEDLMKNPQFQQYLTNMGQGMQNKPSFGQALSGGFAQANQGVAKGIETKQAQEALIKLEDERTKKIMEALKGYGLGNILNTDTSSLYSNPKFSGLLKGVK